MSTVQQSLLIPNNRVLSFRDVCDYCGLSAVTLQEMVEYSVTAPLNGRAAPEQWHFPSESVLRIHMAMRLCRDLDVNIAGAAFAIELLDEIKELRDGYLDS